MYRWLQDIIIKSHITLEAKIKEQTKRIGKDCYHKDGHHCTQAPLYKFDAYQLTQTTLQISSLE